MPVILSIDQSTQGTKGLVWAPDGTLLGREDVAHEQLIDVHGWVSHDLEEIWKNVKLAAAGALKKAAIAPGEVAVIGISNQRETACCWDRRTGLPLCRAIVWQCARAAQITARMEKDGWSETAKKKTGLPLSPYFSAPKYRWMLEQEPATAAAAKDGALCCGTVDSYLVFRMTHGQVYQTDYSNASRTGLLNLDTLRWDPELMEAYGLTEDNMPKLSMSDGNFGETTLDGLFEKPVPIRGVLGDSHAALLAQKCTLPYMAKVTYGTGSSIMMNAGPRRPAQDGGVVTSLAWGLNGQVDYCLEGNINDTGAVITWLVKEMKLLSKASDAGRIAAALPDNGGVYLVPAFSGLGAPYFDNAARAAISGMGRGTTPAHFVRAAEECIAYQIHDVVRAIEQAAGRPLELLCADGGATRDTFLMQFQADILEMPLRVNQTQELSGAGAAYCAAMAAGLDMSEALFSTLRWTQRTPHMERTRRAAALDGWNRALRGVMAAE